jgi:hypothetical protein
LGSYIETDEVLGGEVPADAVETAIPASSSVVASEEPKDAADENLGAESVGTEDVTPTVTLRVYKLRGSWLFAVAVSSLVGFDWFFSSCLFDFMSKGL